LFSDDVYSASQALDRKYKSTIFDVRILP
jgi:hypothetical protein